jgi:DNA-directed RNA polymerase specialized sigma24 family protein
MEALFRESLATIDRVVERVCRRAGVYGPDAEDFAANVKLALMEDDYAILRKWAGRSALPTYLTIVVQRLLLDERARSYGRWQSSAEARRSGEAAILLENLIRRDGRSLDEALPLVRAVDPSIGRTEAEAILARIPERGSRPRAVPVEDVQEDRMPAIEQADTRVIEDETRRLAERTSEVVRTTLDAWSVEDRMLIRFRFGSSMSIADISRATRWPQRPLYRRIEILLGELRTALQNAGIDARVVADVIGSVVQELDFGWEEGKSGQETSSLPVGARFPAGEHAS